MKLDDDWWKPKPLTEEEMKMEIHFSKIKGPPSAEFSPEATHKLLDALNLGLTNGSGNGNEGR